MSIRSPGRALPTDYDVCILGAGIAGIVTALSLAKSRPDLRIALIESGPVTADAHHQSLCEGEIRTPALDENEAPARSRIRALGGTSAYWGGYLAPLAAETFEGIPWIRDSGWPLTQRELAPFYDLAAPYFDIVPFSTAERALRDESHVAGLDPERLGQKIWQIRAINFGSVYHDTLHASRSIDVYLRTTCIALEPDASGRIRSARCVHDGTEYRFRSRRFAIAMGGLENARFLLNACADVPGLLPATRRSVGRFFSVHPILSWGKAVLAGALADSDLYAHGVTPAGFRNPVFAFLNVPGTVRARHRWLNVFFDFSEPTRPEDLPEPARRTLGRIAPGRDEVLRNVATMSEMVPRFENHVGLANTRDRLGQRRLYIDLRLSKEELLAIRDQLVYLGEQLGSHGAGRVWLNEDAIQRAVRGEMRFWGGHNHMCTTRMSASTDEGVVNSDCRFHEHENLYALGSSAFPCGGTANPTFTIGALAIRLSEHLAQT